MAKIAKILIVLCLAMSVPGIVQAAGSSTDKKAIKADKVKTEKKSSKKQKASKKKDQSDTPEEDDLVMVVEPEFRSSSTYQPLPQGKNQPWRLVRKLQLSQDQIAMGTPGAVDHYKALLLASSKIMMKATNNVWSHERNLDAAATYVLIGGNPKVGLSALEKSFLGKAAKSPLKAAIAYVKRDYDEAYRLLNAIEPETLPASLSGQFSLARAMVTSSSDLELTTKYLRKARKLAPGTLIEEAALRRQLRISGRLKHYEEFRYLSSSYMRRFQKSYYVNDFLKAFAYGIVQMPFKHEEDTLEELKNLLSMLDKKQGLFVLAFIARNGTILGKTKLSNWAATQALADLREGSKLHTRMKLYKVATGVVTEETAEESSQMLKQVNPELLDVNDRKLYDAVNALSLRLLSAPLDTEQLKAILMNDQQTYPGEDPTMPVEMTEKASFLASNKYVRRFDQLNKNYKAIMEKVNR